MERQTWSALSSSPGSGWLLQESFSWGGVGGRPLPQELGLKGEAVHQVAPALCFLKPKVKGLVEHGLEHSAQREARISQ